MPTGIDVGPRAIRVATGAGTAQCGNEIRRTDDASEAGEGWLAVETEDGTYLVLIAGRGASGAGDASDGSGDGAVGESLGPLLGGASEAPPGVRGDVVEEFLATVVDGADDEDDAVIRYVAGPAGAEPLAAVAARMGRAARSLDPGMAVRYDAFDADATGVGVAVTAERAVATLAAGGVPVATATVPLAEGWYDLAAPDGSEGVANDWRTRQYEALFAELGARLARTAPAMDGTVAVAVGGAATPASGAGLADAFGADLPFAVEAVSVLDDPASALARGALAGAAADDGVEPPLPAFAVDVPYVGALADFRAAAEALGAGAALAATAGNVPAESGGADGEGGQAGGAGVIGAAGGSVGSSGGAVSASPSAGKAVDGDVGRAVAWTRADLAALDRRAASTARGVSDLVERLEGGDDGVSDAAAVESLRADVEALQERLSGDGLDALVDESVDLEALRATVEDLSAEIERLDGETATAAAVAGLETAVDDLDAAVGAVEDDVEKIRAVFAGLDEDADVEAPDTAGVESLQADALDDRIDDVEGTLAGRVEDVWSAVEDIEDRLVDLEATAEDVPDLESTVESTRNAVADLEDETATLRESVGGLQSTVESVTEETAAAEDIEAVEADVERVREDLASLREEFEGVERVDPATVAELQSDLDGLRGTLISRADRMESLEETTETLQERIETVYQNSAKSEALASTETEVARVRQTAADAMERTNEMTETVSALDQTVADHEEQLGMLSTNVDNLAGSAVTRPEMESDIRRVEERLDDLESDLRTEIEGVRSLAESEGDVQPVEEGGNELVVTLQTVAFVFVGVFGAIVSWLSSVPFGELVGVGFLVFAALPAVLSWLVN